MTCLEGVTPCNPATLYGISKHALHTLISAFNTRAGMSEAWARIFLLYGPNEDRRRLVASVIRALLSGEPVECTHGEQVRDFLHVADAGSALAALVDSGVEGPVNVASGNAIPLRGFLHMLGQHLGRGDLIRLGARPAPQNEPPIQAADTRILAMAALAWIQPPSTNCQRPKQITAAPATMVLCRPIMTSACGARELYRPVRL